MRRKPARLPPSEPPRLVVVVDTEEEFDWSAPFDRTATEVRAMSHQQRAQAMCARYGLAPTYVIDYPVASQPDGYAPIAEWVADGSATLGAHLHPWVSPPFEETVDTFHSFPGNLPRPLELTKLARLCEAIESAAGVRPTIYKAGRYGFGENTASILEGQGFEIDLSANPPFDYRDEGGPDFSGYSADPYWFGEQRQLLGIPGTGAYVGWWNAGAHRAYGWVSAPALAWSRLPGVLSRLGAIDRLRLSPEGYEPREMESLTRHLLARGTRVFTFSYHSPSLLPGCTPYVRTDADLDRFLGRFESYFEFFFGDLGGVPATPHEIRARLDALEVHDS